MNEKDVVRSKVDMVVLVGETVQLKRAGSNYKGLCPFHAEKSPSFMVNPEMGIFKCFGCGEAGDAFAWLMKTEGMSFGEALRALAERTGVKLEGYQPNSDETRRDQLLRILSEAARFYHYLLVNHQVGEMARNYLSNRGIKGETIEKFGLGWAPDDWRGIYNLLVGKKRFRAEEVLDAGLITKSSNGRMYDRFRARVVFPLKNVRGQVLGFSGRILEAKADAPKYINSPETLIYHKGELLYGLEISKNAIRQSRQAVVTEGEMDMLSSWQAGIENVVAIKGSALTEQQVHLLRRYADTLVLGLDMDMAGDQATRRGLQIAEAAGLEVRVIQLAGGKDPDEVARQNPGEWKKAVKEAVEIYQFLMISAIKRYGIESAHGKRKIVEELLPFWRDISNEILQTHWVSQLAQRVQLPEDLIWKQLRRKQLKSISAVEIKKEPEDVSRTRRVLLEEQLVAVCLRNDPFSLLEIPLKSKLELPWTLRLVEHLTVSQEKNNDWKAEIPEELRQKISQVTMEQEVHKTHNTDDSNSLTKIVRYMDEYDIREQITKKQELISALEDEGKMDQVLIEQQAVQELLYALSRLQVTG